MFKKLSPEEYSITPYEANKRFVLNKDNENLSNFIGINYPGNNLFDKEKDVYDNKNDVYARNVYNLINHFYYRSDEPYQRFGIEKSFEIDLDTFPSEPLDTIAVIKISNSVYGQKVKPNSFKASFEFSKDSISNPNLLDFQVSDLTFTVTDDGGGNLYIDNAFIGNIFYANGVIVLFWENISDVIGVPTGKLINASTGKNINKGPPYAVNGIQNPVSPVEYLFTFLDYTLEFKSKVTRYEHQVTCTVKPGEFNGVTNPSVKKDEDDFISYFKGEFTDENGNKVSFRPFVTTIGLYDEFLNLIAVGKLSRPIQKPDDIPITFVVEFDI